MNDEHIREKDDEEETDEDVETGEGQEEDEKIELGEISLEELAEQPEERTVDAGNFSEFMLSSSEEMPTATLPTTPVPELPAPEETLEEGAAEAPELPAVPEVEEPEEEQYRIDNEPQYAAGTSEEEILSGREERGMTAATAEELRHIRPRVEIEEWHEAGVDTEHQRTGGGHLREYVIAETEARDAERKLPFEEKTKYRSIKK